MKCDGISAEVLTALSARMVLIGLLEALELASAGIAAAMRQSPLGCLGTFVRVCSCNAVDAERMMLSIHPGCHTLWCLWCLMGSQYDTLTVCVLVQCISLRLTLFSGLAPLRPHSGFRLLWPP